MNQKEFAEKLTGRSYMEEITRSERNIARKNGLAAVFGCSDDTAEFCGAIDDEVGCYGGKNHLHYQNWYF
ncbi:MAG: hypothetical protein K2O18_03125 [Oscillospiraceae bacterium]|nr:hypothetical protein [Oscillospiraceae bacterium]